MLNPSSPLRAEVRENIEYGRAGTVSLQMDASIPPGRGPFPAVILVHGGGWIRGDRKTGVAPLFQPLSAAGFAWFSISYRLANEMTSSTSQNTLAAALTMGQAVEDVQQAIAFVKSHAREYKIDPDRMALIGESAGGQLASMAALKPGAAGPVQAVVAFYSPSDLVALVETSRRIPESFRQALKGTAWAEMLIAGLRNLSPIQFVHKDMPPFLLIHGTADSLVPFDQSEKMCAAIQGAGASCELLPVEGGGHGMKWWEQEHLNAFQPRMLQWLQKTLTPSQHAERQIPKFAVRS